METIEKINQNDGDFNFDKNGKCSWKQIFEFIYSDESQEGNFKKRFLELFYKI